jgi:rhodanese-related sulfurtransferase
MKKLLNSVFMMMLLTAIVLTGCKDDTTDTPAPETGDYETLSSYMVNNGLDLTDILSSPNSWVVSPEGIVDTANGYTIPGYYVFDIRSAEDFAKGHVNGSVNVALTDVVTKANEVGKDKPILVVCYTGQTASRAVVALRLSGFSDAQVMKFGFSYWSNDENFDKWSPKTLNGAGDQALGSPNWTNEAAPSLPSNDYPTWTSTTTDGAELLAERVSAMLAMTGWSVSADLPLADPLGYNIYNYWKEADYTKYGQLKGAYQIMPVSIANDVLKAFPQSDEFLVYCYTGQTSSFDVAWLQVLGYNAKSISFGVNTLQYTALKDGGSTVWHHSLEYDYVTGK